MQLTVNLKPQMDNVIGTDVKLQDIIVGKIIQYEKDTGKALIQINSENYANQIIDRMGINPIGVSSTTTNEINWNIVGDNRTRMKFKIPFDTPKKWWQFWKK